MPIHLSYQSAERLSDLERVATLAAEIWREHYINFTHRPECIRLWVNRLNRGSIAAYLRLGFTVHHDECNDIGHGYVMDDHVMEWRSSPGLHAGVN